MKIAIINAIVKGSTGKIMLQIGEVATNNNMDCYTFSSKRVSDGLKLQKHFYIDNKIEYIISQFASFYIGSETFFSYISTRRLIKKLDKIKPDIIHLHILHGYYLNYIMLFKYIKKHNIRVIWTLHDCWSFTGRCPHFQLTGCNKWKTGCGKCVYDRNSYPASVLFDRSRKNWIKKKQAFTGVKDLTIVTPSKWLADLVKQSYLKDYPVRVINNGINLDVFKPTKSNFRTKYNIEDKYIILGVANAWGIRKGIDVFAELAKRLDERFQIVLVGTNANVDEQLPDNIISIHRTHNQTELAEIYTTANLFVNPTREEVFGLVNVEALACGTPVVTFDTGGSPECIDSTCGAVVPRNDINAMYEKIMSLYNSSPYSAEACVKRARVFDKNGKFLEYIDLYKQ